MTEVASKWPSALEHLLSDDDTWWDGIPLDRSVSPGWCRGGEGEARRRLDTFVRSRLPRYAEGRPHPDEDAESGLSPYLHFGHLSAHEVFSRIADEEEWTIERLASASTGSRTGWWGMSENAEAFLDQLVTWRELGFNMCHHRDDYDRYGSLPDWARQTLAAHAPDPRPFLYEPEAFETAATHDPIWNAAQTQLATEGRMHNYLRMLWGKKILHWTRSPEEALAVMLELNNKYALDGRDPNSYTGIFWILGRYDRPWGPERPVFGKVRYMSSKNTARKLRMSDYLERYRP
jgi:deoxyribodipyrimidine photo-lyase